ncbi:hypothetical protein GFS24_20185 [Chitinophaga sp. SYP-B3965]|uniref:hypothetical protein n=1 Tax=Chitinophaga sp. SYP-B3965 TaxID=2663120 RepID=UPI001299A50C|nr:hypothetical protein [Chitinophaga sp. SYP-B3965]MRG47451.1 hypothetical protein [Chitinophaga sp. SYP-B3965]
MKLTTYCTLFILLFSTACKKGDKPEPVVTYPMDYWVGTKIIANLKDGEYFNMVGTPDTVFHVGQWYRLYSRKFEVMTNWTAFAYTFNTKGIELDYGTELRQIAPGKNNEIYVLPYDRYYASKKLYRISKDYTTVSNISINLESGLNGLASLTGGYYALASAKNGDVYVGLVGSKDFNGQRPGCYIARSRDKGETFKCTEIPGYAAERPSKILVDNDGLLYVKMSNGDILYYNATAANWKLLYKGDGLYEIVRDFACAGNGNIYVTSTKGFFLIKEQGAKIITLPMPSDMIRPGFENVWVNQKGSIYTTADTLNVRRPGYEVSNCYYSTDTGATWKHVRARGEGASKMKIEGFDVAGRLFATFEDSTIVRECCANVRYIQFAMTTKAVE